MSMIIGTLLKKNWLIFLAHRNKYLSIFISPLIILVLLLFLQSWTNKNFIWQNRNPAQIELQQIPKCYGKDCLTLGYVIQGEREEYIKSVVDHVKKVNGLKDSDVKELDLKAEEVMGYLQRNPNKTQFVVVFCTNSTWRVGNVDIPCYAEDFHLNFYTIVYNMSLYHRVPYMSNLKDSYPKDYVTIKLKKDIDQAIINHYQPQAQLTMKFTDFPSKSSRFVQGISIIALYGSFFIMIPYLILLVMEGSRLLLQKQKKLRIGLNIVGVTHLQFYFSELSTYLLSVVIISLNFCLSGYFLNIGFWVNGLIWYNFLVLTLNGWIIGLLAFCITASVSEKNLGMSILYGFVLYSIVMQWLFTGGLVLQLLYLDNATTVVIFLRILFNLYPSFHFSKIYSDVNRKADSHVDTFQNRFIEGTSFTFDDLFTVKSQHYEKPFPHGYLLPSAFQSTIYLMLTSLIYLTLLYFLDHFVESNRGFREKICQNLFRKRKNSHYGLQNEDEENTLVKITNLQKIYNNKVFALTGVSLELKKGQVVALLGENGAGKSTLINILIGALAKTKGEALVDHQNIDQNISSIRKIIGVCPQFDILWEQLTAGQHIQMFHHLKHIQCSDDTIHHSLSSVHLENNRNGKVCTFSGGMRRRLSLAISLIGDPKLLILDEPTTGMDAKIRLLTWKLILQLRKRKTVLITTHNMEEAECVSDRIMIMSKGRITASGNCVDLKRQFGEGYVIKGFDRSKNQEILIKCTEKELEQILEDIESKNIENWSLHETTLEEVFLNVTNRF